MSIQVLSLKTVLDRTSKILSYIQVTSDEKIIEAMSSIFNTDQGDPSQGGWKKHQIKIVTCLFQFGQKSRLRIIGAS